MGLQTKGTMIMTYAKLASIINELSESEKQCDVAVYIQDQNEFFGLYEGGGIR